MRGAKSNAKFIIGVIGMSAALVGVAVFAGLSGGGSINVDDKIGEVDPSTLSQPVNKNNRATVPNGGLVGKGKDTAPETPPPPPVEEATTTEEESE